MDANRAFPVGFERRRKCWPQVVRIQKTTYRKVRASVCWFRKTIEPALFLRFRTDQGRQPREEKANERKNKCLACTPCAWEPMPTSSTGIKMWAKRHDTMSEMRPSLKKKGATTMTYNFDEIIDRRHTNALNTDGFRSYIFHAGRWSRSHFRSNIVCACIISVQCLCGILYFIS